ncbi:hypothetical protein ACTMQO_20810 [Escherichia coli]
MAVPPMGNGPATLMPPPPGSNTGASAAQFYLGINLRVIAAL